MKEPLIIIAGPTATGKSALAVKLAHALNGEIISADSIQVYRGLDIGSAKVTEAEMEGIPHHLIDIVNADEPWNVAEFVLRAKLAISDIRARGKLPIVAGGTGFYIHALAYDCDFSEEPDTENVTAAFATLTNEELFDELRKIDPASCEAIHMNNRKRVLRAIDFYNKNGFPISRHNETQREKDSPYALVYLVLTRDRAKMYEKIEKRVDKMLEQGLVREVEGLLASGLDEHAQSMQGLGYKEIAEYVLGRTSLEEAAAKVKLETRHFAKRQLTWFRREPEAVFLDVDSENFEATAKSIIEEKLGDTNGLTTHQA